MTWCSCVIRGVFISAHNSKTFFNRKTKRFYWTTSGSTALFYSVSSVLWLLNTTQVCLYLEDDVIEANEVLGARAPFVLVCLRLLQLGLQHVGHALVPLHHRPQLDVGQVAMEGGNTNTGQRLVPCTDRLLIHICLHFSSNQNASEKTV